MDFLIKEGSTLPELKIKIDDTYDLGLLKKNIQNATVTFSMIDVTCGKYIIANKAGDILVDKLSTTNNSSITCDDTSSEATIYYKWVEKDTKKAGIYLGEFVINFFDENGGDDGKLKVPIREKLYIHIEESFGKTSINGF